jgi:thymidine kinase
MFSSKTQELLSKLSRHVAFDQNVLLVCSSVDDRKNLEKANSCTTHRKNTSQLVGVTEMKILNLNEIEDSVIENHEVIGIDEAQFFDDLEIVIDWLLKKRKIIYVAGLMSTSEGTIFGEMYKLIPFSKIISLTAICRTCYELHDGIIVDATMTACLVKKDKDEMVGSKEYIPVCFRHWKEKNSY